MASGGKAPTTGDRAGIGEQHSKKKGSNPKHIRSGHLGWLIKCYGKVLAAVGEPDNHDRVSELRNELKELWERYENAHSEYLDSADLSESKLNKLEEQHEEHQNDFLRAQDTMRRYLTTGLLPRRSPSGNSRQQEVATDEELERSRQEFQMAQRELDRLEAERAFQQQAADLARARLSFYEKSAERSQRRTSEAQGHLMSMPTQRTSMFFEYTPPRSSKSPPLQRSLAVEMQEAAIAAPSSKERAPKTPAEGRSTLREVRRHIARSGSVATQTLRQEILEEWRQDMTEQEDASRPAKGNPQQRLASVPAATAHSVSQQPSRPSRETAEQEATNANASSHASIQQHSSRD